MREIKPKLTPELEKHCGGVSVDKAAPFPIATFRRIVEHVARLSYINHDELLFFRGQSADYLTRSGGTTLYPGIYRGDSLPEREMRHRFDLLDVSCRLLMQKWREAEFDGYVDLKRKRYVQWSILQHYKVAETPLLDLTHSLRVACSFAQLKQSGGTACVYVLGLPHVTNRISINSEHDIVNVRLLSICPPSALRPHFQEGYLAGTTDITYEFETKTELDFKNRLIAKFSIPDTANFWGKGFNRIPEASLYPKGDRVQRLCDEVRDALKTELQPGDVGAFIREWVELEQFIMLNARRITERNLSMREAIDRLFQLELISMSLASELQTLRSFRNELVHTSKIAADSVGPWINRVRSAMRALTQTKVATVQPRRLTS